MSDFFPDDGSVLWIPFNLGDAPRPPHEWFGGMGGLPVIFDEDEDIYAGPALQLRRKTWSSPDSEPATWGDIEFPEVSFPVVAGVELASHVFTKMAGPGDPPEDITELHDYMIAQWRFAWPVPTSPRAWNFVHLIYGMTSWTLADGETEPTKEDLAGTVNAWWKGEVPSGYDEGDSSTWPGTDWATATVPAAPTPPDPTVAFGSTQGEASLHPRMYWPYPGGEGEQANHVPEWKKYAGVVPGVSPLSAGYAFPRGSTGGRLVW